MKILQVDIPEKSYPIYVGAGLIEDSCLVQKHLRGNQVMLVTNETIAPLYLEKIKKAMHGRQCDVTILPDGEDFKNLTTLNKIFDALLLKKHTRLTTLVAIGGGVIGDMTGFAAQCYQRGVNFIQIPTSLLAQVDASVGGKTGVNHQLGKNMIGAFYQPQCVIIDTQTLHTLPFREFCSGLAEVIKHGLIRDAAFFAWLEDKMPQLLNKNPEILQTTIVRCCEIKKAVVAMDEKETGIRAMLNFGHTVGHAIETGLGYGKLLHGEAVAIGMMAASFLSYQLDYLTQEDMNRIRNCIKSANLPLSIAGQMTTAQCKLSMSLDKKILDNKLRFILLKKVGESIIENSIDESMLDQALLQCGFSN